MRFVWIFVVLSSTLITVTNAIDCFNCTSYDGSNCDTGKCTASSHCSSQHCPSLNNFVEKSCAKQAYDDDQFCTEAHDCTMCYCKNDYCNTEIPKPLEKVTCASRSNDRVNMDCDGLTCEIRACTPHYSPNKKVQTHIESKCLTAKLANGCKNATVTAEGITSICTYCNCDTGYCNSKLPEEVKKYHEKLLEPPEPTAAPPPAAKVIECYECYSDNGDNCKTGKCVASVNCLSQFCPKDNSVTKSCLNTTSQLTDDFCAELAGCTVCYCQTDYCNAEAPKPLKKVKCANQSAGVSYGDCDSFMCEVEACTPHYSPKVEMKTKITSGCFPRAKLDNGCKNKTATVEGVKTDCTYCYCDSDSCNSEPPEEVKKYHEKLLESRKQTPPPPPPPPPPPGNLECYECSNRNGFDCKDRTCNTNSAACVLIYDPRTEEVMKYCEPSAANTGCIPYHGKTACSCNTPLCNYKMKNKDGSLVLAGEIMKPSGLLICIILAITAVWSAIRG